MLSGLWQADSCHPLSTLCLLDPPPLPLPLKPDCVEEHPLGCAVLTAIDRGKITYDPSQRAFEYRKRFGVPFPVLGSKLGSVVASVRWAYNEVGTSVLSKWHDSSALQLEQFCSWSGLHFLLGRNCTILQTHVLFLLRMSWSF